MTIPIYIPSLGRWREGDISRGPLPLLPARYWHHTTYVVHIKEAASYRRTLVHLFPDCGVKIMAIDYDGIAEKRERIGRDALEHSHESFMMLDDDINFLMRASPESASQVTMARGDPGIQEMLDAVEHNIQGYAQVGLGMREVNHTQVLGPPPLLEECTKAIRAVAWQTQVFANLRHQRVRIMEDYDLTLQLLGRGFKNAVLWYWMSGQRGTNTAGGCSGWRTPEVHNEAVLRMSQLHPDVTRMRTKETKSGGAISSRLELTIQWKKAYANGTKQTKTVPAG